MASELSLGEYVRRLRRRKQWDLAQFSSQTGLSPSHLSRIENDNAVPNADTVVKIAAALEGDLERMLALADCLPREILERLIRRADDGAPALRRSAGAEASDPSFSRALVEDMDPGLRCAVASRFGLSDQDVEGIFAVLQRMSHMSSVQRSHVIDFLADTTRGADT